MSMSKDNNPWDYEPKSRQTTSDISKQEIIGKRIMKRITDHKKKFGGFIVEITGAMGSGKSSTLLHFADYLMRKYPHERNYFSNGYGIPFQFQDIGTYEIFVKEGSGVQFFDRLTGKRKYLDVTYFKDFEDLYQKTKHGVLTVPFFGKREEWRTFIGFLREKQEFCNIYIDEFSEIAPSYQKADRWEDIGTFAIDLKECRKAFMNIFYNSQSTQDIDHRCRTKVGITIFLPGAHVPDKSVVYQKAVNNLPYDPINGNEAYIAQGGEFGVIHLPVIFENKTDEMTMAKQIICPTDRERG